MKTQEIEEDQPYCRAQGAHLPASITDFIRYQRLSWAGHIARMADDYGEGGSPRNTAWMQATRTTKTKKVLQGTPCVCQSHRKSCSASSRALTDPLTASQICIS